MNGIDFKDLFYSYGFKEYRLSGFEEYSLYADNRNFLQSKDVITFGVGKKLFALRPDVTLSIVKNVAAEGTEKLFYDEKVFRPNDFGGFSYLSQVGVEVIGDVDSAAEAEVLILLKKCLLKVGRNFAVDVSHAGIVFCLADMLNLDAGGREFALKCLYGKNEHDFKSFAKGRAEEENFRNFLKLFNLPYNPREAFEILEKIIPDGARAMLAQFKSVIALAGDKNVHINFSASGDENYYNGLIFRGYIEGVPRAAACGGRYDGLLKSFNKAGGAIGFAICTGELEGVLKREIPAPEVAVLYNADCAKEAVKLCEKLRAEGRRVIMTKKPLDGIRTVYAEEYYD